MRKIIFSLALLLIVQTCQSLPTSEVAAADNENPTEEAEPELEPLRNQAQIEYSIRFAWFYKPPEEVLWPELVEKYRFFILTHRDEEQRDAIRALGANQPFYEYILLSEIQDPGNCEKTPYGNQVAFETGDFCNISENYPDWFLLDSFGNRLRKGNVYYMDPGSEGFRTFWLERAQQLLTTYHWDGIFLDNVTASLSKYRSELLTTPAKYPNDNSLQTAVAGFLKYLQENDFPDENKPIYGNIISLKDTNTWKQYLQLLDGAMIENYAVDWKGSWLTPSKWRTEMDRVLWAEQRGKLLILVGQGDQTDLNRQQFAYASYLLVNNGQAVFRYMHHSAPREIWWYENYSIQLGLPLNEAYLSDGWWLRDFEHGQVRVNPSSKEAVIEEK